MELASASLEHPLLRCADRIASALDDVAKVDPLYLPIPDKAAALVRLARAEERLHELRLRVLACADDVALEAGARSPGAWLAHQTRSDRGEAMAAERLAEALTMRWRQVRSALTAGEVTRGQARVIVQALDELPDDLDPELRLKAEAHLLAEAGHFDPPRLRVLGRKVLEVLAPDLAEEEERRRLEAEERAARRSTLLSMRVRGDGSTDIRIRMPDHVAARLKTYLESMTGPRHHAVRAVRADDEVASLPYPRRLGEAFCALLERLPAQLLPQHGGTATSVMVTIPFHELRSGLGAADLGTGDRITAGQARRLACNADLIPVVLGGASEVLDLGRTRRTFSPAQRRAMAIRDKKCRTEGCSIPAAWSEAHHWRPWSRGGRTDLEDGVLLCPWHHHRAHDPAYDLSRLPSGDVRFHLRR
jgi:hypothetical protein